MNREGRHRRNPLHLVVGDPIERFAGGPKRAGRRQTRRSVKQRKDRDARVVLDSIEFETVVRIELNPSGFEQGERLGNRRGDDDRIGADDETIGVDCRPGSIIDRQRDESGSCSHIERRCEIFRDAGHAGGSPPTRMAIGDTGAIGFESSLEPLRNDTRLDPVRHFGVELGFRRGEELGAVIEDSFTDTTRGETSAHPAPLVDDGHTAARIDKSTRSDESGQTGTDNQDVEVSQ